MRKVIVICLVFVILSTSVVHAQSDRDYTLASILCSIANAQEVMLWSMVINGTEMTPDEIGVLLADYGNSIISDVLPSGTGVTDEQRSLLIEHGRVWVFYGYALQHPTLLDTAVEYYTFHRNHLYLFMDKLRVPRAVCDRMWDANLTGYPDPRPTVPLGIPGYTDWMPAQDNSIPT